MEVTASHSYDASIDDVFEFFCDEQAIMDKYAALGAKQVQVLSIVANEDIVEVKTQRDVPANVPGVLKSLLGDYNRVVQTESWEPDADDNLICTLNAELEGVPVKVNGKMHLKEVGVGAINEVSIDVTSSIPLIGKKLTEFVANDSKKAMEAEYRYISEKLSVRSN